MRVLIEVFGMRLREAKELVHLSDTWADTRQQDDEFHDALEKYAKLLNGETNEDSDPS